MSERIGIAGGGAIASGLACVAAEHGQVVLWARRPDAATAKVEKLIEKRGGVGAGNVSVSDDLDALRDATFIVEAIAEEQDAKAALLRELGGGATQRHDPGHDDVGAVDQRARGGDRAPGALRRPARVQPGAEDGPGRARVPARRRDAETRERARALCAALGKTAVEVPDTPGFVVNRLLFPFLFDAVALLEESGLEPQAIDDCMRMGAGHPMGPLALLDYVGLDVSAAIGRSIGAEVPAARRGDDRRRARSGKKAGRGFYDY